MHFLSKTNQLDYVFFDGNHRQEPTQRYFDWCLTKAHSHSVFVFDDIHWSEGMQEAWEIIKMDEQVTCSIDLFFLGIVFFKPEMVKQDFILKY